MSACYGGQVQRFLSELKRVSPINNRRIQCVWADSQMNPLRPNALGAPGLIFACRYEMLENPPWYIFSQRLVGGKKRWLFCGCYETRKAGRIEGEQFVNFPKNVGLVLVL